jgi:hypothetical protein
MHWTSFQLGDVSTGEPHLYCSGWLTDGRYLSRLERESQDVRRRAAIALHLPRLMLMACGVAALLFGLTVSARAEGPTLVPLAGQITAECAARDLQVVSFLEQHGEAGDLSAAALGEFGLMHLEARLSCAAGEEARALAIYDDILGAVRTAQRSEP